ncbi:MAG: metallophosphoesterase family protein [Burkholderiales bacterium]|nr:metallophosphoesterase family protein [Burkholderiales bacterium]
MAQTQAGSAGELRFLALSDLEGRHDMVERLVEADLSAYDCVVYKGDTPDPAVYKKIRKARSLAGSAWQERTSLSILGDSDEVREAFRKAVEDSAKINSQFARIAKRLPVYGVLGNSDTVPTRIAPHLGLEPVCFEHSMVMLHNKVTPFKGFQFIGYHGRVKYRDENIIEAPDLMFDEDKAREDLDALFATTQAQRTVFVTHVPPHGILDKVNDDWVPYAVATYGETAKEGHIGSIAFRDMALKHRPLLHTFGHVHERPGVEKRNGTTYFNGGALGETGEVEEVIIRNGEVTCRWIRLEDL